MFSAFRVISWIVSYVTERTIYEITLTARNTNFLFLDAQSQSFHDLYIRRRVAILLINHRKAACVIPHGPADAVLLQRGAHVPKPNSAVRRRRKSAIGAEFVTGKGYLIPCSPGGSHPNLPVNAGGVPTVFAIAKQIVTCWFILNRVEDLAYAFRIRRIGDVLIEGHVGASPCRALMRECKRLVEVEVVNNIPVGLRLQKQQLGKA